MIRYKNCTPLSPVTITITNTTTPHVKSIDNAFLCAAMCCQITVHQILVLSFQAKLTKKILVNEVERTRLIFQLLR